MLGKNGGYMVATVIAVSQGKGGMAKTTTAVNLAGALNELGYPTILFDWDTNKPDAIKWKGNGDHLNWINKIDSKDPIKDIEEAKQNYNFVVFDTPPNYEQNAFKAIMASNFVMVPTSPNFLDQENAKEAISVPMLAKKPFKILVSRIKNGTKEAKEIMSNIGNQDICFKSIIAERHALAQCSGLHQWVGQYAKKSTSHKQFLMLAEEVIVWIESETKLGEEGL